MKKLYYYVMSLAFLFALTACSDDDEPTPAPPPSKGAEAVNKIVEVLEEEAEISTFVEILKSVDVANLEEDKLTVLQYAMLPRHGHRERSWILHPLNAILQWAVIRKRN